MKLTRNLLIAASLITAVVSASAQNPGTTPAEMQRGVPGIDVDVGRNAKGAIDVNRANDETSRGVSGVNVDTGRSADSDDAPALRTRRARADRN